MENKLVVPIAGLHCRACEILTEDRLGKLKNVKKITVNHQKGLAEIIYENEEPSLKEIAHELAKLGYSLGTENIATKKPSQGFSYWFSILAGIIIIYWLLGRSHFLEFSGLIQGGFSAPLALLVGLVAGVSTCLALVGGLILSLSANYAKSHPEASKSQKFKPQIFFNLGRLIGFFFLGGLLGTVGSAFKLSSFANSIITIIVGFIILFLGLKLLEIFPYLNKLNFSLPKKFGRIIKINNPFWLGVLTFFLPCGFTQAMQVYALGTGNFWSGGIIMTLFAIGTAPGLLGIGGISALINKKNSRTFFVLTGILVVAFALFNLTNGFRLLETSTGSFKKLFNSNQFNNNQANLANLEIIDGTRIIRMNENNRGYSPNYFVILKDQPVKWIITADAPYSCASSLVVPSLNIQTQLKAGENIFEFTPDELGEIRFSCSMGMYSGKFVVVEDENELR